jgi:hypothetical protein
MLVTRLILPVLLLASPVLAAQPYACGPFLLQPGPTQMTVVIDQGESHHKLWSRASASRDASGYGILKLK